MDKRQQLQQAVKDFDEGTGKYSSDQVLNILSNLGINGLYPGSVSKIIRKLNFQDPENNSIDFEQLLEYFESFQTESKHKIWKNKLDVKSTVANQLKAWSNPVQTSAAPSASPKEYQKQEVNKGELSIIIGPKAQNYAESIKFSVEKIPKAQKGKPFLKLQITSVDNETAKKIQLLIKQNFTALTKTVGQQAPQLKDEFDKIHLNTVVANSILSIFITTSSDQLTELINLYASFYDQIFETTLKGHASLTYEFNFDFNKFIKDPQFTHYEALTKNCKFLLEGECINVLKSVKHAIIKEKVLLYSDQFQKFMSVLLLNSQRISGQIEFDNNDSEKQPQTVTKSQIVSLITEIKSFINDLEAHGFKIIELLKIFGDNLSAEFSVSDWRAKLNLKLRSFVKIFTEEFTPIPQSQYEYYD